MHSIMYMYLSTVRPSVLHVVCSLRLMADSIYDCLLGFANMHARTARTYVRVFCNLGLDTFLRP